MSDGPWIDAQVTGELNEPGDTVEGTYLDSRENTKSNFPQMLYDFIADNGDEFTVRGSSGIDKQMASVPQGAKVRIIYKENRKFQANGEDRNFKVFKVQYQLPSGEFSKTKAQEKREKQEIATDTARTAADWIALGKVPVEKIAEVREQFKAEGRRESIADNGEILPF